MAKTNWFQSLTLTPTELDRFWSKVDKTDDCWIWRCKPNRSGYGNFGVKHTTITAHRASYLLAHGSIADGLVLDHLCRNRTCVNPDHLEPVTPKVNSRRSPLVYLEDECSKGHPRDEFSVESAGQRYCAECHRHRSKLNQRRYRRQVGAIPWAERTHCGNGHELTPENTYTPPSRPNRRECRTCKRAQR